MNNPSPESLRYPVGRSGQVPGFSVEHQQEYISIIAEFPEKLRKTTAHLTDEQLDTPYRPGGWTIRQVVHHCADSHAHAYTRFKLALTEDNPVIKPYREDKWAELSDGKFLPVIHSLLILEGLHYRWTALLRTLNKEDFDKQFIHPEHSRSISLFESLNSYAWHCRHHLAHITELKKRMEWVQCPFTEFMRSDTLHFRPHSH